MTTEDKMTIDERLKYLRPMKTRYLVNLTICDILYILLTGNSVQVGGW